MLPTVRRAGLHGIVSDVDGLLEIDVPLTAHEAQLQHPA